MSCLSADKYLNIVFTSYTGHVLVKSVMWSGLRYCTSGEISWHLTLPQHVLVKSYTYYSNESPPETWFSPLQPERKSTCCKKLAYVALVHSALEYTSIIWDPYLQKDVDSLERVQRKATRWVWYGILEFGSLLPMTGGLVCHV